jgi:poly(3-hydroxybutyrate) depolymerase
VRARWAVELSERSLVVDGSSRRRPRHTWPGGRGGPLLRLLLGRTTREIDATGEIWRFFVRHV